MVSSISSNCAHNYNYLNSSFRANNVGASPSIFASAQPSSNTSISNNLIDRYLAASAYYNTPLINAAGSKSTPSAVAGYNDYVETDKFGREVVSLKHFQNNGNITQNLKTVSPDGTTVEKSTTNSELKNSMSVLIKDKQGRVLLEKNKSFEKINDDTSKTVVDGEVYNVTGLSTDVLTVEHNGEVRTIDLRKMTDEKVEKMTITKRDDGEDESFKDRDTKITEDERRILYSKIKTLAGDDLFRFSESVDEIAYLDADDHPESFYNNRALILSAAAPNFVVGHELGHAVDYNNSVDESLKSDRIKNIRDYEINNLKKAKQNSLADNLCFQKFGDAENLIKQMGMTSERANRRLRDELFAESYSVLNTTEVINFDDMCFPRTLSLIKYCPRTIAQVENHSA